MILPPKSQLVAALFLLVCGISTPASAQVPTSYTVKAESPRTETASPSPAFPTLGGTVKSSASGAAPATKSEAKKSLSAPLVTTCSALAVVLGLFAALVWMARKYGGKTISGTLPSDLIESLGTSALDTKTRITMVRVGSKIVVATVGANGVQPLTEITDPDEVLHFTAICKGTSKSSFAEAMQGFQSERTQGFADPIKPKRGSRLFATA